MKPTDDREEEQLRTVALQNAQAVLAARHRAEEALRKQSEWLRVTLASIGDAVISTDAEGRVTFLNGVAEGLTGWPQAEALGRPLPDVFHIVNEHTRQPVENPALRALRDGAIIGLANHTVLIARDGTERPIDDSVAPIRDGSSAPIGAVLVFRDVTERKQAEKAQARLATIVESSEDAIVSKTLDGVILSWNAGAQRIFGYTAAEAVGRPITLIIPPERLAEERDILDRLRRGEPVQHFETVRVTKDGRRLDISLTVSPIRDDAGRVVGASKIARDITERKRAEGAVRAANERAAAILENINEGFVVLDTDWNFAYVNAAFERLNAVRREDIVGRNHWEVYPATVGTRLEEEYRRVAASGGMAEFENYYEPWDRWFVVKAYPAQGGGICVQVREVTEAKRAQAALRESDEKLRLLADTIPQLAWMARPDGHIFWYNRRWYEYTGTTADQMEGWGWQSVHDPEALPGVLERWRASLASGEPFDMVFPLRGADGVFRPFLTRVNPLRNDAGRVLYWFGTNTDISAQKRAEEASRFLADASATLADLVDYESTLGKVARLAVPYFADWCAVDLAQEGGPPRRLVAVHADPSRVGLASEIHRRYPPRSDDAFGPARVLRTGEPELTAEITDAMLEASAQDEEHLRALRQLGLRSYVCVPLAVRGRPLGTITFALAESGRRYGPADLTLAQDLAHRAAVATENARLYSELREADRRKDEFIALLAHELRNPLAPIRNGLQVIRLAGGDPGAVASARGVMERQLGHMVRLIDDLLDASRINRNKMELRRSRVLLADVVSSAVETARPQIEEAGHALTVALPGQPVHLDADLTRLAQVFSNLLTNSAKYTERGGRIWLTAERLGDDVVVSVGDTGIGIPADALTRIFDMFSQVDRPIERSTGGLGIGLALVKGLVEMHGGTVVAASGGQGRGSTFTVRLPALPDHEKPPQTAAADHGRAAGPRRRILVVDDNQDAAASMAMMLELLGNEVVTARDGLEAVEAAERFRPQVVLMDVGMPRLNGLEATRRIRAQPWGKAVVIFALTGWGQEGDRVRSREAGCDGHLVKPVDLSALQKLLSEVVDDSGPEHPSRMT